MYNTSTFPKSPHRSPNNASRRLSIEQSAHHPHSHVSDRPREPREPLSPANSRFPSAPTNGYAHSPRSRSASKTYYDPTVEGRGQRPSYWETVQSNRPTVSTQSPLSYPPYRDERRPTYDHSPNSPGSTHRSPHSPTSASSHHNHVFTSVDRQPSSPPRHAVPHRGNMSHPPPPPVVDSQSQHIPPPSPKRPTDPMSLSSIISKPAAEPERARTSDSAVTSSRPKDPEAPRVIDFASRAITSPSASAKVLKDARTPTSAASPPAFLNGIVHPGPTNGERHRSSSHSSKKPSKSSDLNKVEANGMREKKTPTPPVKPTKPLPVVSDKELEVALAKIDDAEPSDVEAPGFEVQRAEYKKASAKRQRVVDEGEGQKRKRRRVAETKRLAALFSKRALHAKEDYFKNHEKVANDEVQSKVNAEEKEKKKMQQRNRRRELQKQKHETEMADLQQRADEANDQAEKERLLKKVLGAEKKVLNTTRLLNGEVPNRDLRETTPVNLNLEGGQMGSFPMSDEIEPPKKRAKTGTGRLKKSREQKQAEKDAAASAHAAMERGEDLAPLAPKGDPERHRSRKEREHHAGGESSRSERGPYESKAYNHMYDSIWKDIARKDIPRVVRIKDNSTSTKQSNLRKTAQLASKEARRWQLKTNKSQKDTQARAKRVMREMLSFWKRNEREERDQRKMAERQELETARKAEADREANRQKRKLNFLISQTELYSHFIGKKVKTDEVERSTDDVDVSVSTQKIESGKAEHTIDLPDNVKPGARVRNFEDLDFDAEDETELHNAAMANAQNAVEEAQARARAFDKEDMDEEGEMNFQNPTSLQTTDIAQPNMLTCALKDYQLKGLNWLVNLYEQGINGILADEMGLGKTVQSISVMAHLAEAHNIWGPFLVIAPASTLHNWQQEIVRFTPGLKVLPYWGNAKDRKVLRKFWDRKHITYSRDSQFHVLVTSYQLVVQDTQYFQRVKWQYMILDEAQAIKSSASSRWKSLLGFHCRNRLLLTGTPIQNNMQELWALLHFIMPSLFDSHDEFSEWFSKDIESHAQSNTKLNEDQLKRLHMILKPFMLRRLKAHVQKELGDKIEEDVYCDLTYRQRAYYTNLRNKISLIDLIEKAAVGDDQDTATLMNLVMQFRKVCNHPDLFERADTNSPVSFAYFAETASFLREGHSFDVGYSTRSLIELKVPRLIGYGNGRLDRASPDNATAGWRAKAFYHDLSIWKADKILHNSSRSSAFSWLPMTGYSASQIASIAHRDYLQRAVDIASPTITPTSDYPFPDEISTPAHSMLNIVSNNRASHLSSKFADGYMNKLINVSRVRVDDSGLRNIEPASRPAASAPPVELYCSSQGTLKERSSTFFNVPIRRALFGMSEKVEAQLLDSNISPALYPVTNMLPPPNKTKARYTSIQCPSMRRFVTDSGKLAKLDAVLRRLKEGNHRVLLYFQMTRMIDLMEEYLTYRNYKYCRLDGSTKLEDRRDTVNDFQNRSDIFIFLLSTRAGGLGINLTAADTVIFYDSDWNPTIDSQAMDRAHRLGQTRQVTVYRMITRSTIEERIRRRALQKEEVQRVVISGGAQGATVDFNARSRENRTKDIAMWLADDEQAEQIERKEKEIKEKEEKEGPVKRGRKPGGTKRGKEVSLDDMYHEGEGHFDDANAASAKQSGAATPVVEPSAPASKKKGTSKKAKSVKEKLALIDGGA